MIPIEKLRELFDYDHETGVLTRKSRPREYFTDDRTWRAWCTRRQGKPAGWQQKGYLVVSVLVDGVPRKIAAHRVAWALVQGRWPENQIDHRDGNPLNNRLANLREATQTENNQNQSRTTLGTSFDVDRGRFVARIYVNRQQIWLGRFATHEEAHAAYLAAKARLHTFQPVPRE